MVLESSLTLLKFKVGEAMAKLRLIVLLQAVVILSLSRVAPAQVTVDKNLVSSGEVLSGADVLLLVRTKDFKAVEDMQNDIKEAATTAGVNFDQQTFRMEPIDYTTWKKFGSILGGFDLGMQDEEVDLVNGSVRITPTAYRNQFVLQVPPAPDLEVLKLQYKKPAPTAQDPNAMKTEVLELKPGVADDEPEKMPLRRKGLGGQFTLSLPSDWVPVSVNVKMKGQNGDGARLDWPQQSLYLGRMNNFTGELPKLFSAMSDANVLGVPVKGLHQSRALNIVMADFVRPFSTPVFGWTSKNTFFVRVPYDPKLPATRVWFLFPMSKDELSTAETRMQAFPVGEYQFSKQLRSSKDNPYQAVMPEDSRKLNATETSPPQWLVLPKVVKDGQTYFEREYEVDDADVWRKRYLDVAMSLYLYEFDTRNQGPKVLRMAGDGSNDNSTRMYTTQEIPRWVRGLSDAK